MPGCVPTLSYDTLEERLNGFFFDYPTWIVKVDTLVADVKSGKMTSKDLNSLIVGIFGGNGIEGLPKSHSEIEWWYRTKLEEPLLARGRAKHEPSVSEAFTEQLRREPIESSENADANQSWERNVE